MKIAFTTKGKKWDSPMDSRFGRTDYILIYDEQKETFNEYLIAVKAFQDEMDITINDYSILANYSWAAVHGLATLLIDGQIQVLGKNYGLPTLLTDEKPNIMGHVPSMIAFSKQTLMNFWDVILNGIAK